MRDLVVRCAALVALAGCQTTEPEVATVSAPETPVVPAWALEQCSDLARPLAQQQIDAPLSNAQCDPETGQILFLTANRPRDYGTFYSGGAWAIMNGVVCVRLSPGTLDSWDACEPLVPPGEPVG